MKTEAQRLLDVVDRERQTERKVRRDAIAREVLPAILGNQDLLNNIERHYGTCGSPQIAEYAYELADAMERESNK